MGIVGGYDAHFYCDCCNDFCEVNGIGLETYQDIIHLIKKDEDKKQSWLLRDDGVVLCGKCKTQNNPELIKESDREGSSWNIKKESLTSNIYVFAPREPTELMVQAGIMSIFENSGVRWIYKAMIETAEGK
jgi:ferredoxin